jgi:hypothetical protein
MKQISTFLLFFGLLPLSLKAQQLEIHANLNSGLYSYRGAGAESVSRINGATYTNNPYGSKGGLSYGLSFNIRKVTRHHFIYGADLGYEMLRSRVNLEYQDVIGDIASSFKGNTYLNNSFINLFPYMGGRFLICKRTFDLVGGMDIGRILSSTEKGHAKSTDNAAFDIQTSVDRLNRKNDLRPRIQLSTEFDHGIGVYIGYSHGIKDYKEKVLGGGKNETYSRMWRLGVSYRLK